MSGEELLQLQRKIAQHSDQQAYKALYQLFFERLYHFSLSMVKSAEAAEEIVSDVFIRVWQQRARIDSIENLPVYLYVSAKNYSLNYLSKKSREIITYFAEYETDAAGFYADPEQLFITSEMVKRIENAINQLPPKCKIIFRLIREDGLKYREVAEILSISVKTVEAQVAIAMKKIGATISLNTADTGIPPSGLH